MCVVAKGLAGPSGTCRLNPIPALLSRVDERSPVLLWDPALLPQRADEVSWVAGHAGGKQG